ncbi:MAG: mechanosensitive ion channel family protein [Marinifilaceae bacterium]|jgi:small-conductance mechanosensitive channel|nr:mechanosensitive ion channel family protein [Marinifilaceae bacterium]
MFREFINNIFNSILEYFSSESFDKLVHIVIVIICAVILRSISRKLITVFINKYAKRLKVDPTNFSFLKNSVGFIIYATAIIYIFSNIEEFRRFGASLFAGAGVIAIVIGFASQKAFANIISGIFILIFKPFKVTDIIEFKDGQKGKVEEITLWHTIIKDYENRRIIIPNSVINDATIINSDIQDSLIRKHIIFSISYDSDIDKAIKIIQEETIKHPLSIDNRTESEKAMNEDIVVVRVYALNDFSVDLKAYVWSKGNDNSFFMKCDVLKSIKQRFDKEGIEIPFPYRTIVNKNDL